MSSAQSPPPPATTSSPTPSKSSLRRTSGSANPSQRSLLPPPSPHFDDTPVAPVRYSPRSPPNQTLSYSSDEDEDEPLIYPPIEEEEDLEPERFTPFFTLIEDGLTSEHHIPAVHYIFADDDNELVTEAALRSLEVGEALDLDLDLSADKSARDVVQQVQESLDGRLPRSMPGVREHYLILDVHPSQNTTAITTTSASASTATQTQTQQPQPQPAYTIISSTSLSPDWQITSADITSAPTMSDTPGEDDGLMLRISGRGFPIESNTEAGDRKESLEDMIARFSARLGEVKMLIESDVERGTGVGVGVGEGGEDGGRRFSYALEQQD